jgi:hypothetical protein
MGERGRAYVRLVRVRAEVGDLGDSVRDPHHLRQAFVRDHVQAHLRDQPADHGEDVGIAGTLPVAVRGALDVGSARGHRRQRVGYRAAGVVLGVDAEPHAGPPPDVGDDLLHAHRQHAAVGVTEDADVSAGGSCGLEHPDAVAGIVLVAVEEVLAVQEHATPGRAQERDRVAHHRQVLVQRGAQRLLDMPDVGLGHQRGHRCTRVDQRLHLRVVLDGHAGPAGGAERHHHRVLEHELAVCGAREELGVLGHGSGPAALDEPDADLVEEPGHRQLVGHRVGDALALRSVAQRGVEDVELVGLHGDPRVGVWRTGWRGQQKDPSRKRERSARRWSSCLAR